MYGGSVVYSDCCEPVLGSLFAATAAESAPINMGYGMRPSISPDGTNLAAMLPDSILIADLDAGTARAHVLPPGFHASDLAWSDDDEVALLVSSGTGEQLRRHTIDDQFTLRRTDLIEAASDPMGAWVTIAGAGSGYVTIALTDGTGTTLRYIDDTDAEIAVSERRLPGAARDVQQSADGALLWLDGTELWFEPGHGAPRSLGTGYSAAWFVG